MTAPKPSADREPADRDDDATTEVIAGAEPDRTPTEVLGGDADRTTEVLDTDPGPDADRTTKVLPEASAHSTRVPPRPKTTLPKPPPPAAASASAPLGGASDSAAGRAAAAADTSSPYAPAASATHPLPRPRVRWAGIIWGLVFAASAVTLLWVLADPERRDAVGAWWTSLTPAGFALTALLVAGGLLLVGGLAGLARRLSHRGA